jgi:hypothetical protein
MRDCKIVMDGALHAYVSDPIRPILRVVAPGEDRLLDQTFSTDNFRRIYDLENRKGKNVERMFSPALDNFTNQIRTLNEQLRALRSSRGSARTAQMRALIDQAIAARAALKSQKDDEIKRQLDAVSADVLT